MMEGEYNKRVGLNQTHVFDMHIWDKSFFGKENFRLISTVSTWICNMNSAFRKVFKNGGVEGCGL